MVGIEVVEITVLTYIKCSKRVKNVETCSKYEKNVYGVY